VVNVCVKWQNDFSVSGCAVNVWSVNSAHGDHCAVICAVLTSTLLENAVCDRYFALIIVCSIECLQSAELQFTPGGGGMLDGMVDTHREIHVVIQDPYTAVFFSAVRALIAFRVFDASEAAFSILR